MEPHELAAHLRNNTASPASPPASQSPLAEAVLPIVPLFALEPLYRPASRASSIRDLLNPTPETSPKPSTQESTGSTATPSGHEAIETYDGNKSTAVEARDELSKVADDLSETTSEQCSAKKRNHDEMIGTKILATGHSEGGEGKTDCANQVKEPLQRSASFVRLAMTVDGAVKVRTRQEETPSPEKPRSTPSHPPTKAKTPIVRSKSAVNGVDVFRDGMQGAGSRSVAAGFGRSRDARTWEFYCDSNSKDALSTQAEAETSGSAISAINLIRSNSFKSRSQALSPSLTKTNTRITSSKEGKPKLSRAKSSLGRLQGVNDPADAVKGKPTPGQCHVRSPSGDSDKENWAPGTRMSEHSLRRTQPSGSQRPVLHENEEMTYPDASSSRTGRGDGSSSRVSPTKEKAKGEEMDCIQGLLSLSQGAWMSK